MGNFLLGSYLARIGKSGRIKIPEKFRTIIEEQYGKELFITSLSDQAVQIYPLTVWEELARITKSGLIHLKPDVKMFMRRVNLKGGQHEIDSKGRVLITSVLREKTKLDGEIEVIGLNNHLELWNKDAINKILEKNPLSDEDFEQISMLANKVKTE
jgi:MraZ protein